MADITVKALTTNIMNRYDRNQDGKISVPKNIVEIPGFYKNERNKNVNDPTNQNNAENAFKADETQVSNGYINSREISTWKFISTSTTNTISMVSLFKDADADGDGQVTRKELENELKSFDQNHNGIIGSEKIKGSSKSEIEVLKDSYPEIQNTKTYNIDYPYENTFIDDKSFTKSVYGDDFNAGSIGTTAEGKIQILKNRLSQIDKRIASNQDILSQTKLGFGRGELKEKINNDRQEREKIMLELSNQSPIKNTVNSSVSIF